MPRHSTQIHSTSDRPLFRCTVEGSGFQSGHYRPLEGEKVKGAKGKQLRNVTNLESL